MWGTDHEARDIFPGAYPWPFESQVIDAEMLAAWGSMGKFRNFPGNWPLFFNHWVVQAYWHTPRIKFYWLLANGLGRQHVDKYKDSPPIDLIKFEIPEVFLQCICSK